jgi:hypothetical protein
VGLSFVHFPLEDGKSFSLRNYWAFSLSQWTMCKILVTQLHNTVVKIF